jgi:mannose-6-phosphate isomerase-like protein (cupin superfamily)
MGRISADFKVDAVAETGEGYSISEWWLDPHTEGPDAHSHPADDVFYVLAGAVSMLVGTEWIERAPDRSSWCRGNVTHHFENRGSERARVLNLSAPATWSNECRVIAQWFWGHARLSAWLAGFSSGGTVGRLGDIAESVVLAPSTRTGGSPTSSAHTRVRSVSTELSRTRPPSAGV